MPRRMFCAVAFLWLILSAAPALQAQMLIENLDGPVTQNEINSFKTFMRSRAPLPDNTGNRLAHHTSGQQLDALGLMYEISGDPEILDIFVNWADYALAGRNDPDTGLILWTGNRELTWPIGANPDGTAQPSTGAENGEVMSHVLHCALLILQTPSIWDTPVAIGDDFGFGATYKARAQTYVRECDRTEDTYLLKWFLRKSDNKWIFPTDPRYDGSSWRGLPFPWNQQWMLNGALIRLADCHTILGDNPDRVRRYDTIIKTSFDWWLSSDLSEVQMEGFPAYLWHYVTDVPQHVHGVIATADLSRARNTAIFAAGILWVKNARYNGTFPTERLALTPPMGWNSWNRFGCRVSDQIVRAQAEALVSSGMRDLGYVYVNIDDCWEGERDEKGFIHSNEKFPDMKALADYVHSLGLKLGIYSSPGPIYIEGTEDAESPLRVLCASVVM